MNNREIDKLVAEKVMGLKLDYENRRQIPCPDGILGCAVVHYSYFPQFSTNIQDAWLVLEQFDQYELFKTKDVVIARLWRRYSHFDARAENAALAICLAAIKSRGVEFPVKIAKRTREGI